MKILDRYILKTFLKSFISVFVILMLIFVLQAIWLYIKELAGKDLDVSTIFKFLFYITPTLIPLILPLTILLSSIMVFGAFAENYEFAAMKSTGISLQRAMKSLSLFIAGLALTTFIFSNNVIPWAEYQSYNLRKNIAKLKPAMVIAEGQFNTIGDNINIKVEKKTGKNGRYLQNVIIHQSTNNRSSLHITIVAKTGELISPEGSNILKLILYDGYYYNDTPNKDARKRKRHEFTKTHFKKYVTNFDLAQMNSVDLDEKQTTNKYSMLDIMDLNYAIDSLKGSRIKSYQEYSGIFLKRSDIEGLNAKVTVKNDTLRTNKKEAPKTILELYDPKRQVQVIDYALNTLTTTKQLIKGRKLVTTSENSHLNRHAIALHKKFALAAACIILFFVGAPLGALIRKGGMGLPMVIAIVLFLTYHFMGLFAENSAKSGNLNPVLAAYFSTLVMLPLSIFLTKRATEDRGIFEFDHIIIPLKKKLGLFKTDEEKTTAKTLETTFDKETVIKAQKSFNTLSNSLNITLTALITLASFVILYFVFKNNKLPALALASIQLAVFSVVTYSIFYVKSLVNKKQFNRIINPPKTTNFLTVILGFILFPLGYFILKSSPYIMVANEMKSNIQSDLDAKTLQIRKSSKAVQENLKNYKTTSLIAVCTSVLSILLFLAYFILKNNKLEALGVSGLQISAISFCIFVIYYLKSEAFLKNYKKDLQLKQNSLINKIIGFILYPILYIQNKKSIV